MAENQNIEYKESWRTEYLKWVCGFANAQGGTIYIGVDDKGRPVGLQNAKKLMDDIPNQISDALGIVAEVNMFTKDEHNIIEIRVDPCSFPISYHGEYHYRSGSTKQQLKGNALTQFLLKKTGLSWDATEVTNVGMQDLSPIAFDIFRTRSVQRKRMDKNDVEIPDKELLERLNLFTEDGNFTKAAYLLFARNPEKRIIGSNIKIGYFNGADILYQDEIGGSLLEQAERTIDLIFTKYLKAEISYDGVHRIEKYPFAYVAVREAIYNSIAHRAYNYMNSTQIRVYDDKLIISNDAAIIDDWTTEKLMGKHKSVRYNPLIATTLFKAGFIEIWGRGIEKMCEACKENGNPLPQFELSNNDFTIVFFANNVHSESETKSQSSKTIENDIAENIVENIAENIAEKLPATQAQIVRLMAKKPSISAKEIAEDLSIAPRNIQVHIKKLQEQGLIRRVGPDKGGHWEVVGK